MRFLSRPVSSHSSNRHRPIIASLAFACIALAIAPPAAAEQAPTPATITLQGRGEVTAAPDMAVITTRVVSVGKTAAETLDQNSTAMNKVIADIKGSGVAEKDIQTSGFSIYPRYDHRDDRNGKPPAIIGYEVSNGVTVQVRDLSKLGAILETVVSSGVNSVDGIRFGVSETDDLLDEARKGAVADARKKAELYTAAAGVKLGRILSISEAGVSVPRPQAMRFEAAMASAPVPIQAGETELQASVTITWELGE